jgi:ADP-ribose pyrophosphatase YjhB (NUDIX family)
MIELIKVTAYITCEDKLLVFRHVDYPEAGIQVPSGTAEVDEDLEEAVLREAEEESGLADLQWISYLGETSYIFDSPGGEAVRILRFFYHLGFPGPMKEESWQHWEESPSVGDEERILFELYWVNRDEIPELSGKLGMMLDRLPGAD